MLTLHRRLIQLRRSTPALSVGAYAHVYTDNDLLVYERAARGQRLRVALNLSPSARTLDWREPRDRVVVSTHLDRAGDIGRHLELRADEGVVVELTR
jgi:alpha-glucosidase